MEELVLITIVALNLLFAKVCGWMEGIIDDKYYYTETIAGRKKHFTYMLMRGAFWSMACLAMIFVWNGRELVSVLCLMVPALLMQFRFEHDGEQHATRNKLNPNVSPDRFKQDDDGLSGSLLDKILGHTYQARLIWMLVSCVLILMTLIGLELSIL